MMFKRSFNSRTDYGRGGFLWKNLVSLILWLFLCNVLLHHSIYAYDEPQHTETHTTVALRLACSCAAARRVYTCSHGVRLCVALTIINNNFQIAAPTRKQRRCGPMRTAIVAPPHNRHSFSIIASSSGEQTARGTCAVPWTLMLHVCDCVAAAQVMRTRWFSLCAY